MNPKHDQQDRFHAGLRIIRLDRYVIAL